MGENATFERKEETIQSVSREPADFQNEIKILKFELNLCFFFVENNRKNNVIFVYYVTTFRSDPITSPI